MQIKKVEKEAKPEKKDDVEKFQHTLIRLASLLYCTALQQISVLEDEAFEILDKVIENAQPLRIGAVLHVE